MDPVSREPEQKMWTREELRRYYGGLHSQRGRLTDLEIVCHPGAPIWLNRYVDHAQRQAFRGALSRCGSLQGARVLDVGCGTGRWSVQLRDRGAQVTAVDVSPHAIERNRKLHPGIEFHVADLASADLGRSRFDLIVSVTVLQHIPPSGQLAAAASLARALTPGGRILLMENIRDRGGHVFARTIGGWIALFGPHGVGPVYVSGYEYDLPLRLTTHVARLLRPALATQTPAGGGSDPSNLTRAYRAIVLRPSVWAAYGLEVPSRLLLPSRWATHAAVLLRERPTLGA